MVCPYVISLKERRESTRGVILLYALEVSKYYFNTINIRDVMQHVYNTMDIRDVKCCYVLETHPSINTSGVTISRAYVTVYLGVELQHLNVICLSYLIIVLLCAIVL